MSSKQPNYKRQWRDYQTKSGIRPVKDFLLALPDEDRATILEEMEYVREHGKSAARHLYKDIYEVRVPIIQRLIVFFLLAKDVLIRYSSP